MFEDELRQKSTAATDTDRLNREEGGRERPYICTTSRTKQGENTCGVARKQSIVFGERHLQKVAPCLKRASRRKWLPGAACPCFSL